jgi:hypothetical protein
LKSLIFDSVNNSSHPCLSGVDIFLSDLSITYINFRLSKKPTLWPTALIWWSILLVIINDERSRRQIFLVGFAISDMSNQSSWIDDGDYPFSIL